MKQYADRDTTELDAIGKYFMRHMDAMTRENLVGKAEIAAELAHRDYQIAKLANELLDTKLNWNKCIDELSEIVTINAANRKCLEDIIVLCAEGVEFMSRCELTTAILTCIEKKDLKNDVKMISVVCK